MQQTETLKLNLIETGDPISPVPLNENAEKIEAALTAKADAADVTDLGARVTVLEGHHFACGSYRGTGSANNGLQTFHLGFAPAVVLAHSGNNGNSIMATDNNESFIKLTEDGFQVRYIASNGVSLNTENLLYYYLAIG